MPIKTEIEFEMDFRFSLASNFYQEIRFKLIKPAIQQNHFECRFLIDLFIKKKYFAKLHIQLIGTNRFRNSSNVADILFVKQSSNQFALMPFELTANSSYLQAETIHDWLRSIGAFFLCENGNLFYVVKYLSRVLQFSG